MKYFITVQEEFAVEAHAFDCKFKALGFFIFYLHEKREIFDPFQSADCVELSKKVVSNLLKQVSIDSPCSHYHIRFYREA